MKWKTKSGEVIDTKHMSDSHLQNSIAMLKRLLATDPGEQIYTGQGEMAELAVEQENRHNEEIRESIKDTITELQKELTSRSQETIP